eukprot:2873467-Alexandrium_andersonii.AAC.1
MCIRDSPTVQVREPQVYIGSRLFSQHRASTAAVVAQALVVKWRQHPLNQREAVVQIGRVSPTGLE